MGFWIFMLIMVLLIPLTMLFFVMAIALVFGMGGFEGIYCRVRAGIYRENPCGNLPWVVKSF